MYKLQKKSYRLTNYSRKTPEIVYNRHQNTYGISDAPAQRFDLESDVNTMAKKVLIVEDDNNIAELLHLYLEKEGFEVEIYESAIDKIVKLPPQEMMAAVMNVYAQKRPIADLTNNYDVIIHQEIYDAAVAFVGEVNDTSAITG